jgi:predicted ATPase/DNA-binding CsgD family transcriptional regulator
MARPSHRVGNLPAESTTFVGRRRQLGEIRARLASARLVSLVGPGGVGKTRLGLRIGSDLARGFADGAWFVELAEVRDPDLVPNAVLAALDLRDQASAKPVEILASYLQTRRLLLVIDNCEHVLAAAGLLVAEILRSAPNVRVIATSREPLQVSGEQVIPVAPLELPQREGVEPLAQARQNEAIALFTERAVAASGAFEVTVANKATVVALCRRLDGLPLAIELAAVRTRVLSVEQILERLDDRFALLTGGDRAALPRHQTLRTAIDWSFELLTEPEQILLRRLCVFGGRFTLEDVEGVCGSGELAGAATLDLVASLVDKSLVTKEDIHGSACYRLHETMREYAILKLRAAGEEGSIAERCLEFYRQTCLQSADGARYALVEWLRWADLEIDNIRAMLHQCVASGDRARGLDIAVSMRYYWLTHGTTEAIGWLDQLLDSDEASAQTRVQAYYLRGWLSLIQADPPAARPWLAQAIAMARETGQLVLLTESLSMAVIADHLAGDEASARLHLDEALAIGASLKTYPAAIERLQAQTVHAMFEGDLETVRAASAEGVDLSRDAGDLYQLEAMLRNLATAAMMSGDLAGANSSFVNALQVARRVDNRLTQSYGLAAAGWYAGSSGQARAAARLLGAAEALATQTGADISGPSVPYVVKAKEAALAVLGAAAFEAEFTAGKRLSREEAVRLAVGESAIADGVAVDAGTVGPLAKRELEVSKLIAEGLTNKQIGAQLFISERTVASHVRSIMDKLGFNNRAQIAVWMTAPAERTDVAR